MAGAVGGQDREPGLSWLRVWTTMLGGPLWEQAQRQATAALGATQLDQLFGSLDSLEDLR